LAVARPWQVRRFAGRLRVALGPRLRGLRHEDAVLLLPASPATAAVLGPDTGWSAALAHWGIDRAPPSAADLIVTANSADVAALRPSLVLLSGADRRGRLRRAGYRVTTYQVRWLSWDVVLAATDRRGIALARRTWAPRGPRDGVLRALVIRGLRPLPVTVAVLDRRAVPASVAGSRCLEADDVVAGCLGTDVRDTRRRAAFLVADRMGRARAVVKMARSPRQEERASREQGILAALPRNGVTPLPLGAGRSGPIEWSAETAISGQALGNLLARRSTSAWSVIGRLADWLVDIAALTARPVDWRSSGGGDELVALRGPSVALRGLLHDLDGVPAVLTHGDLGSGHNVVVDRAGRPRILDWETARKHSLPLLDLIPLVCGSLARLRGKQDVRAEANYVLALATGRTADSAWFLGRVADYARRLDIPRISLGPLALLAWGHESSKRLVREELLVAGGMSPERWTSAAELVLQRWQAEVGVHWRALHEHLER
jgi:phosphotransferase family enzyme